MPQSQTDIGVEATAASFFAADADIAPHQSGDAPRDHQAKAGATIAAGHRVICLNERMKQSCLLLSTDAYALVADFDAQQQARVVAIQGECAHADFTLIGKLDGIANEIEQNLTQTHGVSAEQLRKVW